MKLLHAWVCLALAGAPLPVRAAVSVDNFALRNAGDLVALCTADPGQPLGSAALNFCHGFTTGSFRVLYDIQLAIRAPAFCMPVPDPSRNDVVSAFSLWAAANPARMASPAEDALLSFLSSQYPCPK